MVVVVKFHICILMRSLSRKDTSRYITGGIGECLYRMPIFPGAKRRWGAGGKTREESRRLPGWGVDEILPDAAVLYLEFSIVYL